MLKLHPEWFCTLSLRSVTEIEGNIWCLWVALVGWIVALKTPALLCVVSRSMYKQMARFTSLGVEWMCYDFIRHLHFSPNGRF